jgi:regulator of replication initiation timing
MGYHYTRYLEQALERHFDEMGRLNSENDKLRKMLRNFMEDVVIQRELDKS